MTTIDQPSRAHTHLPPVSWWHVIVAMEQSGYSHAAIGAAIGVSRTGVESWKNRDIEPSHENGERLCSLWVVVTGRPKVDIPRRVRDQLSAAAFR